MPPIPPEQRSPYGPLSDDVQPDARLLPHLTMVELAARWHRTPKTIERHYQECGLRPLRFGGRLLFPFEQVLEVEGRAMRRRTHGGGMSHARAQRRAGRHNDQTNGSAAARARRRDYAVKRSPSVAAVRPVRQGQEARHRVGGGHFHCESTAMHAHDALVRRLTDFSPATGASAEPAE